ncbi:MAG: hypothetical protein Q4D53_02485 [Leptotrichiaceae bacterium]|nr:hypothetical protein [Leptotrichiaceae bacterium]
MGKKVMKIFSIILFLVTAGCVIYGFIDRKYKTEIYVSMNENYSLRRYSEIADKDPVIVLIDNKKKEEYDELSSEEIRKKELGENYYLCYTVSKVAMINNYYVGYLTGKFEDSDVEEDNSRSCEGYFYVKKNSDENKIKVSEKEITEKFGKNIKYKNPSIFVDVHGGSGDYIDSEFMEFVFLCLIIGTIISFIVGVNSVLILKERKSGIKYSPFLIIVSLILIISILRFFGLLLIII